MRAKISRRARNDRAGNARDGSGLIEFAITAVLKKKRECAKGVTDSFIRAEMAASLSAPRNHKRSSRVMPSEARQSLNF